MPLTRRYLEPASVQEPVGRRLRILAFDPSLATRIATASVNEITVAIPWEELEPGPIGEYIEVIDNDPASGVFYYPVDLDHPHLGGNRHAILAPVSDQPPPAATMTPLT